MTAVDILPTRRKKLTDGRGTVGQAEIDTVMRRFFEQNRVENIEVRDAIEPGPPSKAAQPRRDFETAFELLDRASSAITILVGRCQHLEEELDDTVQRAAVQAAEQRETIEKWKRLASSLRDQIEAADRASAALKARCDVAEAQAANAEGRAASLERASALAADHAAMAETLSTRLHDKVLSAFGIGSRLHSVLQAIAVETSAD